MPLPLGHRIWFGACLAAIGLFLSLHALYLLPTDSPEGVTRLWGTLLFREVLFSFFPAVVLSMITAPLAVFGMLLLAGSARLRRACVRRAGEPPLWQLRPWLHSLLWLFFLAGHAFLDIDPYLLVVFLPGLALVFLPLPARAWLWLALAAGLALSGPDAARLMGIALLSVGFLLAFAYGAWLHARERFAALVGLLLLTQVCAATAPLLLPGVHGGTLLARDMAYSFCEPPEGDQLFAAVRRCDYLGGTKQPASEVLSTCRGRVIEYDRGSLEKRADHRFFSEQFVGRLEALACVDDTVQVGMDWTLVGGTPQSMSLLEFESAEPSEFQVNGVGNAGNVIAWDRRRRVVYYLSDEHPLVRRDLESGEVDTDPGPRAVAPQVGLTDLGIHEGRDALFLMDHFGWIQEVDLESLRVERTFAYGHGWELAVDQTRDRLYVSGSFGLEVVDLGSGRIVHRAWLGLGGRRPAIDYANDRIYVPVEGAGKLHVLERSSLRHLGSIPLGGGIRYPHVSADGRWLLATNAFAHFHWSAPDLARRFD